MKHKIFYIDWANCNGDINNIASYISHNIDCKDIWENDLIFVINMKTKSFLILKNKFGSQPVNIWLSLDLLADVIENPVGGIHQKTTYEWITK